MSINSLPFKYQRVGRMRAWRVVRRITARTKRAEWKSIDSTLYESAIDARHHAEQLNVQAGVIYPVQERPERQRNK